MHTMTSFVQRRPLGTFLGLSLASLAVMTPFAAGAPQLLPLLLSIVPALVALLVTVVAEGRAGPRALLRRCLSWRVGFTWYGVALGVPLLGTLAMVGLAALLVG